MPERYIASRRVRRALLELEGFLAIAYDRGAETEAPDALTAFDQRIQHVKTVAESGDLLGALELARRLRPELLAFEQRFRN